MSEMQPYKDLYPNLFKPMVVGKKNVVFKNRIFVPPMSGINYVTPEINTINDYGVEFFGSRARGGAACVHMGEVKMDNKNSVAHDTQFDFTNDNILNSLHEFNEIVHAYDAKSSIQLNHDGHFALPQFCNGMQPMSASERLMPNGVLVREMNEEDMNYVADIYVKAAIMAKRGGFDMILMHLGHGWLLGGWLSDIMNKRTDKYGGSLENKMRFPRMILERIREAVGDELLIEVRMSGRELSPGGITIEDTIEYVKMIEDLVDMVHLSCGTRLDANTRADMVPAHFLERGHTVEDCYKLKQAGIKIPVGVVGGINEPEYAEQILAEGKADYVLVGRSFIAEPNWAEKIRRGKTEDIRPCLRCNYCLDGGSRVAISKTVSQDMGATKKIECAVNPLYGAGGNVKRKFPAPEEKKKVVVIGGGVAGMQAAITAVERGHEVTLYEKEPVLGGQLFYTDYVWFKKDMGRFREYLKKQVYKHGVNVKLGVEATPEIIKQDRPDAVIVAVGAEPLVPPIAGIDNENVMSCLDAFGQEDKIGQNVVIIGGGLIGCETSIHLGGLGKNVTVVEMGEYLAPDAQLSERLQTLQFMDKANVVSHTETRCVEIKPGAVIAVDKDNQIVELQADTIVLCTGMKARQEIRDSFAESAFDVINVGDCKKVSNIKNAVHTAFDAALIL